MPKRTNQRKKRKRKAQSQPGEEANAGNASAAKKKSRLAKNKNSTKSGDIMLESSDVLVISRSYASDHIVIESNASCSDHGDVGLFQSQASPKQKEEVIDVVNVDGFIFESSSVSFTSA